LILIWRVLPKLRLHVSVDVVPEDLEVIVSIRTRVHVIEAYCVHQFMNNDSVNETSIAQRDPLSSSHPSDHGVTAAAEVTSHRVRHTFREKDIKDKRILGWIHSDRREREREVIHRPEETSKGNKKRQLV
jgi:hypothetical protein